MNQWSLKAKNLISHLALCVIFEHCAYPFMGLINDGLKSRKKQIKSFILLLHHALWLSHIYWDDCSSKRISFTVLEKKVGGLLTSNTVTDKSNTSNETGTYLLKDVKACEKETNISEYCQRAKKPCLLTLPSSRFFLCHALCD